VGSLPAWLYILLLIVFIASIPLTMLARYAWNSRRLFLLFSAIGLGAMIVLFILVWPEA
jgi:hypothetical protein